MMKTEEYIYYIKLGKREAFDSLFSIFNKRMRKILEKYEFLLTRIGYSNEDIKIMNIKSFLKVLNSYVQGYGGFFSFSSVVYVREITNVLREHSSSVEINLFKVDLPYDDYLLEDSIKDEHYDIQRKIDYYSIVEQINDFTDVEKEILKMYIAGFSYNEISQKQNYSRKKVSNVLQKIRKKIKTYANKM